MEQIVDAAPGLPALDALVPLVVEQLVDVLAFVEEQKKQEDARMDQLEDRILMSAADVAAWRRWASGAQRKRKKRRKKKLPKASGCGRPL